jgi:5-formyltetrahydrofolate cyclo-ligase
MLIGNLKNRKTELRAKHRRFRQKCPPEIKSTLDQKLTAAFLSLDEYKSCKTLFAFVSSDIEVDTSEIIKSAFANGKRVAVPKCRNKKGLMDFYYINSTADLKRGAFNILEPDADICEKVTSFDEGLCIVPGLCFDKYGYRLGFGKGYYDRFLDEFSGISVGLCYSKCIEQKLPVGAYDKPVDILITEKYTNRTN